MTDVVRAVRALLAAPRVLKIYPAGHQRVQAQFEELARLFGRLFENRPYPCTFTVRGMRIEVNGEAWKSQPELATGMAFKLRRRRIRGLTLRPGLRREEISGLVTVLSADHKELLQEGGVEAYLPPQSHPHIGIEMLRSGDMISAEGFGLSRNVLDALEECFSESEIIERLDRLRGGFAEMADEEGGEAFEQVVSEFFSREEWVHMAPEAIRDAFHAFLGLIEQEVLGAAGDDTVEARIASIQSLFQDVAPEDLLAPCPAEMPDLAESGVDYGTPGVEVLRKHIETEGSAIQAIRADMEFHDPHENSLLILCELMVSAQNRQEYKDRRQVFLNAFSDKRYPSASVARILRYIAVDLPSPQFENRDNIVSSVFDSTSDEEALVLFLCSMTKQPDVARPILSRLVMRPNPFALLVRLMRAPLLGSFMRVLRDKLVDAARLKPDALARWARKDRPSFFAPEVFEPLFSRGTELLGGICKEILLEGSKQDRRTLIDRLRAEKSESALRLLVLGMPYGDTACDQQLLESLADFQHPLAVSALREVVHRNNLRDVRSGEVSTAFQALNRIGTEEGWAFLWEVVQRRVWLLPIYRRELRQIATQILEGEGGGK